MKYVYDEYYDCIICQVHHVLSYLMVSCESNREYKNYPRISADCPTWHMCTNPKDCIKPRSGIFGRTTRSGPSGGRRR